MGLPPVQGHNNLRLTNNANLYPNYNYRLDTTQYKTVHRTHKHLLPPPPKRQHFYPPSQPSLPPLHMSFKSKKSTKKPTSILKSAQSQNLPYKCKIPSHLSRRVRFERQKSHYPMRMSMPYLPIPLIANRLSQQPVHALNQLKLKLQSKIRAQMRKKAIISNMPLINVNSSIVMVNNSPFALRDPRFGILHHCSQSISYF